jgi:hypothetical protein
VSTLILHLSLVLALGPPPPAGGAAPDSAGARGRLPAAADSAASGSLALRLEPRGALGEGEGGGLLEPDGLASDAFGRLMVSDAGLHRLLRFDRDGRRMGESGALGSAAGELRRPGSVVAFGATGLAVLDRENRRVLLYDLFGRLQGTLLDLAAPDLESRLGRVEPGGLAADRGGALYLSDPARERILAFDGSGRFLRALGGFGTRPGTFRGMRGLATTPRGELVVTERLNGRVQRLDAGGRPAAAWALALGPRPAGALPVAADEQGRVAVADEDSGRLWVFDAQGRKLAETGGLGGPRALAFAPDGTLLVAEGAPARIRRFALRAADAREGP